MTESAQHPCLILVEDQIMISMMLEDRLEQAGYRMLTAGNVDAALNLVRQGPIDVAVLDINLEGELSFPVAEALRQRGIGFTFASGHGIKGVPPEYRGEKTLQKPYDTRALLDVLARWRGDGASDDGEKRRV